MCDTLELFAGRYCWYRRIEEDEVDSAVLSTSANVVVFVKEDLNLEDSVSIVWFEAEPDGAEFPKECKDESEIMLKFPNCLIDEGRALGRKQIGGFTPERSTALMMIRADVFDSNDSARDRLRVTIAHEMRHIWQNANWKSADLADGNRCESDAISYQVNAINRYIELHKAPQ